MKNKNIIKTIILTISLLVGSALNNSVNANTGLDVVRTGDTTTTFIFYVLIIGSLAGIAWLVYKKRKEK